MPILEFTEEEIKNSNGWMIPKKCSFIEPGVVNYADVGMVLVRKEVLDKMANSMRGKPVVNEDHREVSPEDFDTGNFDGMVDSNESAVWFDPSDAKYHCSFSVKKKTLENINRGYKVSCAYKVTRWGPGGIHNNVPYEREVLDGEYTHLAIVNNPRYEGVRIYNSKGAVKMTLQWIKKLLGKDGKEIENAVEIDTAKSVVEMNGRDVPLDELINAFKEQEEKAAADLANRAPAETDMIEVNGKKVTIAELKNAYKAKNDESEDEEKKKKEKADADEKERKNAEEKEKMEKDHDDDKHKDEKDMKENCLKCKEVRNANGRTHFQEVRKLANSRDITHMTNELPEPFDGIAEGSKRFGSEPAAKKSKGE